MILTHIRVSITLIATTTAIIFILLSYLFPDYAILILTIEVILLPSIYITGNYYAEHLIEKKYKKEIIHVTNLINKLNSKLYNKDSLIYKYKEELKWMKNKKPRKK